MPGAGKTFLGKYAAQKSGKEFIDLDQEIMNFYNMTIAEIFKEKGEPEFRQIELDMLKQVIRKCKTDTIIATGGGTPCYNNAMSLMNQSGMTVLLDAEIDFLYENITEGLPGRPIFNETKKTELKKKLNEMQAQRMKFYSQSKLKVSVYRGLSPDLFTNTLHLSTFAI